MIGVRLGEKRTRPMGGTEGDVVIINRDVGWGQKGTQEVMQPALR